MNMLSSTDNFNLPFNKSLQNHEVTGGASKQTHVSVTYRIYSFAQIFMQRVVVI